MITLASPADIAEVSLHGEDPGEDGSRHELSGGSPAYARAVAPRRRGTRPVTVCLNVPKGQPVKWVGFWGQDGRYLGCEHFPGGTVFQSGFQVQVRLDLHPTATTSVLDCGREERP